MSRIFKTGVCWISAIVLTAACALLSAGFGLISIFVIVTAVLAALDAKRIRIWQYRSDIAMKPGMLFLVLLLIWPIVFPWYLGLRFKILAGVADVEADSDF
jgi:hypothetical protein